VLLIQFLVVLAAIIIGARLGGIGLGVMGGVGLLILTFVFGLQPTAPPVDVMLMIAAVISAASCMQAAGGLEYMVKLAERILRKNPSRVTILSPIVTYLFTFVAGTGHIAYSVLPVIAEVARETRIRPERPLGIAVIASQQAITASPISAATVALLGLLSGADFSLFDILKVSVPATLIGVLVGACCSLKVGKELMDDPEYQRRLKAGMVEDTVTETTQIPCMWKARCSVALFLVATFLIVLFGSIESLRPVFTVNGESVRLGMPAIIEIVMLSVAALILLITRIDGIQAAKGSIYSAGMQAVIAIFGIAWMGDTFINGNIAQLTGSIEHIVQEMPWLFGLALFVMSILLYSQAATVRAVMPLGLALGISPALLVALFPAVNGYFFIPNYPTVVAAINFDRTGTTRIGKYVLNHSFMMPGMVSTLVAIVVGILLIQVMF
jgi:anaerobic C4-dicarboxylate transporter DcuA